MNLMQIVRTAHLEVDAIRADGTVALWTTEESVNAANIAMERAARILRLAGSNILTTTLRSTDAAAEYVTENYDPATLQIVSGTSDYELPPDCVTIINILPLTTGYDEVRFAPAENYQRQYVDNRTIPSADLQSVLNTSSVYRYTVVGRRTLRITPTPMDTFDIELEYRYRPAKLMNYTTGSVAVVNGSAAVHGKGCMWLTSGVRAPAELLTGTELPLEVTVNTGTGAATTSTTTSTGSVVLTTNYPRVESIDGENDLTLTREWGGVTMPYGMYYTLSMVPVLPEEHHQWLAQMTASILLRKVNLDISEKSRQALEAQLADEVRPEVNMRQSQESIPVEPFRVGG